MRLANTASSTLLAVKATIACFAVLGFLAFLALKAWNPNILEQPQQQIESYQSFDRYGYSRSLGEFDDDQTSQYNGGLDEEYMNGPYGEGHTASDMDVIYQDDYMYDYPDLSDMEYESNVDLNDYEDSYEYDDDDDNEGDDDSETQFDFDTTEAYPDDIEDTIDNKYEENSYETYVYGDGYGDTQRNEQNEISDYDDFTAFRDFDENQAQEHQMHSNGDHGGYADDYPSFENLDSDVDSLRDSPAEYQDSDDIITEQIVNSGHENLRSEDFYRALNDKRQWQGEETRSSGKSDDIEDLTEIISAQFSSHDLEDSTAWSEMQEESIGVNMDKMDPDVESTAQVATIFGLEQYATGGDILFYGKSEVFLL